MKSGILLAAAAASAAFVTSASAQTGVSGPPDIPARLATMPDASASPTPVISPPPPIIPQRPAATTPRAQTAPPAPASPSPARPAAPPPPAKATPLAPLAPAPAPPAATPAEKNGKRSGAAFYTPYLSANDVLDKAILDLTAEVKAHPDDPALRNDLGNLLARRGFAKEAVEQYQKAAKLDKDFYLADYNEGLLWEKEGKPSSAIKAYERSIHRKPGFPLSRYHLGFLLEREGKTDAAVEEYAKALRIDPSLRWPARNPLVVQSRLLYRASIQNYSRDLAGATLAEDPDFANRAVWERLHPQHPVDASDLESEAAPEEGEPAPAVAGTGSPTTAPLIGGKAAPAKPADARRQQLNDRFHRNRSPRPTPGTPPQTVVEPQTPPPAEVPAPPEDENAPNPAMLEEQQQQPQPPPPVEPPPPHVAFARSGNRGIATAARLA